MASVQISKVRKAFGSIEVIKGVNVPMEDGEFVILVGPSGCGKSTLLRMICGLESTTSGDILIGGKKVDHLPPKERDIAMVFQSYALYPHMTVAENMAFSMKLRNIAKTEIDKKVKDAAAVLNLTHLLDRQPRQLSGGQRQRVAMGRAIVRDPKVFLFDEPLSNLDAKLRVQMRGEIKALQHRLGTTTVYVTHDQIEAMTMANKIVVMQDGKVEQIGSPLELYDRPINVFVAGFIGSPAMNMLEGTIEMKGGKPSFKGPGGSSVGLKTTPIGSENRPVLAGIRPEYLTIAGPGGIDANVVVVEPTGPDTHVEFELGGSKLAAVFHERHNLEPGQKVSLMVDPARMLLFDKETGRRIIS